MGEGGFTIDFGEITRFQRISLLLTQEKKFNSRLPWTLDRGDLFDT